MASIILIDDYDHFRMIINMMLENSGHEVRLADSGEKGIELFKASPADIVITDLHMPSLSGTEIIATLKKISEDVKIIVMSGFLDNSSKTKDIGADIFIAKPVSRKELFEAIDALLA